MPTEQQFKSILEEHYYGYSKPESTTEEMQYVASQNLKCRKRTFNNDTFNTENKFNTKKETKKQRSHPIHFSTTIDYRLKEFKLQSSGS